MAENDDNTPIGAKRNVKTEKIINYDQFGHVIVDFDEDGYPIVYDPVSRTTQVNKKSRNVGATPPAHPERNIGARRKGESNLNPGFNDDPYYRVQKPAEALGKGLAAGMAGVAGAANAAAGDAPKPGYELADTLKRVPFANGQTLPQDIDPRSVHQTPTGVYVTMKSQSGPRQVAVTLNPQQVFSMQTGGRWDGWTPAQRRQYLQTGAMPPEPKAAPTAPATPQAVPAAPAAPAKPATPAKPAGPNNIPTGGIDNANWAAAESAEQGAGIPKTQALGSLQKAGEQRPSTMEWPREGKDPGPWTYPLQKPGILQKPDQNPGIQRNEQTLPRMEKAIGRVTDTPVEPQLYISGGSSKYLAGPDNGSSNTNAMEDTGDEIAKRQAIDP